ncbi:MAG: UDP-N-acetylglucosamine 2-epimerase (non-hydrolyzing) [Deltaproteobacteria bacterium]|nr:UDP-N-acetylglucosamine 2-epimerase (non-hydrolyzing) [Deltaproteobacteria bacterium]
MGSTKPKLLVDLIVGARPNFVKVAPVHRALRTLGDWLQVRLVHTGQHYDTNMSDVFFAELGIPEPDIFLGVGSGSHGAQTGAIINHYEEILLATKPALTLVFGDVNSTMACAIAAVKLGVPIGHVEAGLRSFDRTMPEEINRVVTDHLADLLFTPSADANVNLEHEGISSERIHLVGNVMIDTLLASRDKIRAAPVLSRLGITLRHYVLLTLHRPSNVDSDDSLGRVLLALESVQRRIPVVFPIHPRTRQRLESGNLRTLVGRLKNVRILDPQPYCDFLRLMSDAAFVITDSGGVQEETTCLGVPCLTVRPNTERPITVQEGTSILVGNDTDAIVRESERILDGKPKVGRVPDLWDGHAAPRIGAIIEAYLKPKRAVCGRTTHGF